MNRIALLFVCSLAFGLLATDYEFSQTYARYSHSVQGGTSVTPTSNTYNLKVPSGYAAKVTLTADYEWSNCASARFYQYVNGTARNLYGETTEFLSDATIRLSAGATPDVSWTELYLTNPGARIPHYGSRYHYYTYYFVRYNYTISASYVKLNPDLTVTELSLSSDDAAVDEEVTLYYTIANVGRKTTAKGAVARIYDGSNQIGEQAIDALLQNGGSCDKTFVLPRLSAGAHTLKVVVDAANVIDETSETNNTATIKLRGYKREPVDVVFAPDNGDKARTRSVVAGDTLRELPVPSWSGFDFLGWFNDADAGYQVTADTKITMAQKLYAHWKPYTCTVAFNRQGGIGGDTSLQVTFLKPMPFVEVPTRIGYTFNGYWDDLNGTGTQYVSASGAGLDVWMIPLKEATLYAHWIPYTCTAKLDLQGGDGSDSVVATFGEKLPCMTVPTRDGWIFQGFYSSEYGEGVCHVDASGAGCRLWDIIGATSDFEENAEGDEASAASAVLYAYWLPEQMEYTVTLDDWSGQSATRGVVPMTMVMATYASKLPTVSVPQRPGYVFQGYYTELDGAGTKVYTSEGVCINKWYRAEDATLYAKWEKAYHVSFNANGGTGTMDDQYFIEDDWVLNDVAFTRDGYALAGWALTPDGAPVFADGGTVTQASLGYTEGPETQVAATLYAAWGTPVTAPAYPGVNFVTGGNQSDSAWTVDERTGKLQSGRGVSWIATVVAGRGLLGYSTMAPEYLNGMALEVPSYISATIDSEDEITKRDLSDTSGQTLTTQSETVAEGNHLLCWTLSKQLSLHNWRGYSPTTETKALTKIYNQNYTRLQELRNMLLNFVFDKVIYTMSYHDREDEETVTNCLDSILTNPSRAQTLKYQLISAIGSKGYNINRLRNDTSKDSLFNEADSCREDKWRIDYYFDAHTTLASFTYSSMPQVGFVSDDGGKYEDALAGWRQIARWENKMAEKIEEIDKIVLTILRENQTIPEEREEDAKNCIMKAVEYARSHLRTYGRPYSQKLELGICDRLGAALDGANFNTVKLKNEVWGNITSRGTVLIALCADVTELIQEIYEKEKHVDLDCGVVEIREVLPGGVLGTLPDAPVAKEGYSFLGWWTTPEEGGEEITAERVIRQDELFYARWGIKTVYVSFIPSNGEETIVRQLSSQETLGELPVVVRKGYALAGWYHYDVDGTESAASIRDTFTENTSFTAAWTKNTRWEDTDIPDYSYLESGSSAGQTYQVTYNANGGTGSMKATTVKCGTDTTLQTGSFQRNGYLFAGWSNSPEGTVTYADAETTRLTDIGGANVKLYAVWEASTSCVKLNRVSGQGGTETVIATYSSPMPLAEAPKREGYVFQGYYDAVQGGTAYYDHVMRSVRTWDKIGNTAVLYARWTAEGASEQCVLQLQKGWNSVIVPRPVKDDSQLQAFLALSPMSLDTASGAYVRCKGATQLQYGVAYWVYCDAESMQLNLTPDTSRSSWNTVRYESGWQFLGIAEQSSWLDEITEAWQWQDGRFQRVKKEELDNRKGVWVRKK